MKKIISGIVGGYIIFGAVIGLAIAGIIALALLLVT